MKVVDLRPWPVRLALAGWKRSGNLSIPVSRTPVTCYAADWYGSLLDRIMARRVNGRPAPPPSRPFLVSVGNLALGGTGKTPVVGALAIALAERGLKGAILTRGFGSDLAGPLVVHPGDPLAADEARWHAGQLSECGWTVVQSRSRPRGLLFLLDLLPGLDVVLLEDAHQTADLARHLDVAIVDSWARQESSGQEFLLSRTGPIFPFGPWRETAAGAKRAGILLIETEETIPAISTSGQPVAVFHRRVKLRDPHAPAGETASPGRWAGLSGVAHPHRFEQAAAQAVGSEPSVVIRCSDHVQYTTGLVGRILQEMEKTGTDQLVTTAKDWVKLEGLWPGRIPVQVADLAIVWGEENALPDLVEKRVQSLTASF